MEQALTKTELSRLKASPLFKNCSEQAVTAALSDPDCIIRSFELDQPIYQPHQFSRCLGILLTGGIRVTRGSLVISVLTPGNMFGAAALFADPDEDYATTLTVCDPCRAVLLSQELVSRLMDSDPCIRDNYIRYLSGRIRFLSQKISSLVADGVEGRLKQYLLTNLTPKHPRLTCSATELAKRLDISRASLYRAFDMLEQQKLIRRHGRSITVPDLRALDSPGV